MSEGAREQRRGRRRSRAEGSGEKENETLGVEICISRPILSIWAAHLYFAAQSYVLGVEIVFRGSNYALRRRNLKRRPMGISRPRFLFCGPYDKNSTPKVVFLVVYTPKKEFFKYFSLSFFHISPNHSLFFSFIRGNHLFPELFLVFFIRY